jgi:hypothetical protein
VDIEDAYRISCMPDGYCWLYAVLLMCDWTHDADDEEGVERPVDRDDLHGLFTLARRDFPPGLPES